MSKDPAFLFYSSDFLTGISFMSDQEVGCYIKLMCYQHQIGHLKEEEVNSVCSSLKEKNKVLSKFKKDENGFFYNERLEQEINKRANYILSRSNNRKGKTKKQINDSEAETLEIVEEKQQSKKRIKRPQKEEIEEIVERKIYGEFKNVFLSDEEYGKLKEAYPNNYHEKIEALSEYISSSGTKYKSHYATILSWARRNGEGAKTKIEQAKIEQAQIEKDRRKMQ